MVLHERERSLVSPRNPVPVASGLLRHITAAWLLAFLTVLSGRDSLGEAPPAMPAESPRPETSKLAAEAQPAGETRYKGKPAGYWIKQLEAMEVASRKEAVEALAAIGPDAKAAVPALLKALDDNAAAVRVGAIVALGRIGPGAKPAVPKLLEALMDQDKDFRLAALQSLGSIGPDAKEAVPVLLKTLKEERENTIRSRLLQALGAPAGMIRWPSKPSRMWSGIRKRPLASASPP